MDNAELYSLRNKIVGQITDKNISTKMCMVIEELITTRKFVGNAFLAHPNLDLDVEKVIVP